MPLLAVDNSTTLFVMGALLIAFVLMRRSQQRGKFSKLPPISPPHRPQGVPAGHHLDAPGAMARWEVEMHDLARDLNGQLDSKIVIVEQLLADTRQAVARLEAALVRAEQVALWQQGSGRSLQDDALGNDLPGVEPTNGRAVAAAKPAEPAGRLASDTTKIHDLADRGLSAPAIAHEVGVPLGEVELILSVRGVVPL